MLDAVFSFFITAAHCGVVLRLSLLQFLRSFDDTDHETGILLMGASGHGKSATGNSILRRQEFDSREIDVIDKNSYHVGYTFIGGRTIKVVDIPGLLDSEKYTAEEQEEYVVRMLTKTLTKFPHGFHAVLMVVSYKHKLTVEMQENLYRTVHKFDEHAFKMHGVLVMSHGDHFELDYGFEKCAQTAIGMGYEKLLDTCGGRSIVFDNATTDHIKRHCQVETLLDVIDGMENKGARYIPEICRSDGEDVEAFERDRNHVADVERISRRLGLLKDNLYNVYRLPEQDRWKWMGELKEDVLETKDRVERLHITDPVLIEKLLACERLIDKMDHDHHQTEKEHNNLLKDMQISLENKMEGNTFWKKVEKGLIVLGKLALKALLALLILL